MVLLLDLNRFHRSWFHLAQRFHKEELKDAPVVLDLDELLLFATIPICSETLVLIWLSGVLFLLHANQKLAVRFHIGRYVVYSMGVRAIRPGTGLD